MVHRLATALVAAASLAALSPASATIAKLNADDGEATIHRRLADVSDYDSEKSLDTLSKLLQMKTHTRKLDDTKHNCGVIFYYHIPGTEGTAVNEWLQRLKDANGANYISSVGNGNNFVGDVEKSLENKGWTIVYAQDDSLAFHFDESKLVKWREAASKQQCQFVSATMFADTIDHSVAHTYKKFAQCNCTPQEFKQKRKYDMNLDVAEVGLTNWPLRGQLDYFLFNNGEGTDALQVNDRVKRGVEILQKHFDLVLLNDRDKFVDTVLKVTGWSSPGPLAEKVHGDLIFTKDLVSQYSKLAAKSGDADFIDVVGHVYNNDLGYLFDLMVQ